MKFRYTLVVSAILLMAACPGYAQEGAAGKVYCSSVKSNLAHLSGSPAAKTTVADVAEDDYDVKYLRFNLALDNQSTSLSGDVTTVAQVVAAAMSKYVFELKSPLVIDSVFIDGDMIMPVTTGFVQTVTLLAPKTAGTMFTAHVYYHGTPVSGTSFLGAGITNATSPSWGSKVTSTLSESYHANDWWPSKLSLTDKIDSVDMWITVPDTLMAGSNGLLQQVTTVDATHKRFEWKERYPIDQYLISLAVSNYVDYSYYMHYTGSTDSTLVQNYVYNNPATLPFFKSVIDSTGMMIDYLSTLYGRYPFWQEKYGHCMAPINGGMEHQTMTTLGFFEGTLVAHELGHQWFGDNVTCGSWADIFANEGFAAYTEYLFIDHFRDHTAATADMVARHRNVKSQTGGSVYVYDTTDENRIFDSRLSYDKGACMLHMLRFIISDDTSFFRIYRLYQQQHSGATGTIADFKATAITYMGATTVNGVNLDTFFNQWAYQQGYPIYNVSWNQSGSDVYVQLNQFTSMPSSVPLFTMPVELKLRSAAGDTVVRIINDQATQLFHFSWSNAMNGLVVDPNAWLVDSVRTNTRNLTLAQTDAYVPHVAVNPNPATANWVAEAVPPNSDMLLTDIAGRILWSVNSGNSTTLTIPAASLTAGVYLLRITGSDRGVTNYKLMKK